VLVLVPAEVPKGLLAESLPSALAAGLRAHNGGRPGPEQIRSDEAHISRTVRSPPTWPPEAHSGPATTAFVLNQPKTQSMTSASLTKTGGAPSGR
jgi:hypothetical protein